MDERGDQRDEIRPADTDDAADTGAVAAAADAVGVADAAAPAIALGPMLRYVNAHSATIWLETDRPCRVEVWAAPDPSAPHDASDADSNADSNAASDDPSEHPTAAHVGALGTASTFTVHGHHYALVVIEELEPGASIPYEVHLDGVRRWPLPDSTFPPSRIRTSRREDTVQLVFGSCRAAAPHVPPYTCRLDDDPLGKGVDALRSIGLRMLGQPPEAWPQLLLLAGDQVYADDSSPSTSRRIERRHDADRGDHGGEVPDGVVADFEEYTWLYRESWTPEVERWVFSTVPSAMIFDDHDMIDDWNISQSWVRDIRREPWWSEHIVGGLVSYWVHQHLGNLSPSRLREEGLLEQCVAAGDATELLHHWALASEEFTPLPGGYQFSFDRHFGDVHLVVMDVRNGRVLEPGARRMLDEREWSWVRETVLEPAGHVVLASSLPVFVPGGLHGIQQWNEAVCDGVWGTRAARLGERMRRSIDLEGWPAFDRSFHEMEELLRELATGGTSGTAPSTISIVGGDIHFGYVADIELPDDTTTIVRQVVCSPLRNILRTRERRVMRFGASRVGRRIGAWLQRRVGRGSTSLRWELTDGPVFDNNVGTFTFRDAACRVVIEVATLDEHGDEVLRPVVDVGPKVDGPVGEPGRSGEHHAGQASGEVGAAEKTHGAGPQPGAGSADAGQPGIDRARRTTVPSS